MRLSHAFLLLLFFSTGVLYTQNTYNVLFENDKDELTLSDYNVLTEFYKEQLKNAVKIHLVGHTDSVGSITYNEALSKRRVEKTRLILENLGTDASIITSDYKGELSPLNKNEDEAAKSKNRRVEIIWEIAKREIVEEAGDIQDLYDLLEQDPQNFCIDPTRDTLLHLPQGTIISIPANAFATSSKECVVLNVKEVYKYSDMIMENLSTSSNGQMLETGGMIYTEANDSKGNKLALNNGKALTILMPTDSIRNDMRLFYGERDPHSNAMNWELAQGENKMGALEEECLFYDGQTIPTEDPCRFFFCRMRRFDKAFKGMYNDSIKDENKKFRAYQKELRNQKKGNYNDDTYTYASNCDRILLNYGVTDIAALKDTLAKIRAKKLASLFEQYGVNTMEEYQDTLQKIQLVNAFKNNPFGAKTMDAYQDSLKARRVAQEYFSTSQYYITKVTKLGWINCDAFSKIPANRKINMTIHDPYNINKNFKIVFRKKNSIMQAYPDKNNEFMTYSVPKGLSIWVLGLKYNKDQAYLHLEKNNVQKDYNDVVFEAVSLPELKARLRKLDN